MRFRNAAGREDLGGRAFWGEGGRRLSGAAPGQVLAGRYRLDEQLDTGPEGSVWRALDSTLERYVSIRLMRPGHPFAADVIDAARRAALIDDSRLVRVLDVGSDRNMAYVVTESVDGDSLASLMGRGRLPAPLVRRIVGEAAESLSRAAGRGLHHLRLTPRSIIVRPDGSVTVLGTAVEAAAAGLEPDHSATASRVDAVALTGLVYAGLTGRWPLGDAGFTPAPRAAAGPVAPADIAPDVPNDLDTLCVVTLGRYNDGPRSPAELAQQLAPWPDAADALDGVTVSGAAPAQTAKTSTGTPAPHQPHGAEELPTRLPDASDATSPPNLPADAPVMRPAPREAAEATSATSTPATSTPATSTPAKTAAAAGGTSAAAKATAVTPAATPTAVQPGASSPPGVYPAEGKTVRAPGKRKTASGGRPPADRRPVAKGGSPAKRPAAGKQSGANGKRVYDTGEQLLPWADRWGAPEAQPRSLESTGSFPLVIPPEQPPREQSRLVIAAISVSVVLGLVFAVISLRDLAGSGNGLFGGEPTFTPSPSGSAPRTSAAAANPEGTGAPAAGARPEIAAIRALDPLGDGDEDTARSPRAVDGDEETTWRSQSYRTAEFGGLKDGVGLSLRLKEPATVRTVAVDVVGSGGEVELRGGRSTDIGESSVLATSAIEDGTVTLTARPAQPSNYVILWFTKLPRTDGKYRVEISEVRVQ